MDIQEIQTKIDEFYAFKNKVKNFIGLYDTKDIMLTDADKYIITSLLKDCNPYIFDFIKQKYQKK